LFIIAFLAYGAFLILAGQLIFGIIVLVIAALYTYFLYSWRSRIPFAKIMLKSVLQVIQQYPSTVFVGVIGMILETAFAALFFFTVFGWVAVSSSLNIDSVSRTLL
jgi:hypothetical protein